MGQNTHQDDGRRIPRLERIAYHEAGHAVLAVLRGRSFGDVSIEPSGGVAGRVDGFALTEDEQNEIARTRRRLERHVRSEIMIYYAGHLAESIRIGKVTLRGAEADLAQAEQMAKRLYADEGTRGAFVLWLWHLTREALEVPCVSELCARLPSGFGPCAPSCGPPSTPVCFNPLGTAVPAATPTRGSSTSPRRG